jgi:hypothetical protein
LKEFEIQEHLFYGQLKEVAVQIFKRSVIFKSDLKQKLDFNFDSYFKFILKVDSQTVLASKYMVTTEKVVDYRLINYYLIVFAFNQQNLQNWAMKGQIWY